MVQRATYESTEKKKKISFPSPLRVTRVGPQAPTSALYNACFADRWSRVVIGNVTVVCSHYNFDDVIRPHCLLKRNIL